MEDVYNKRQGQTTSDALTFVSFKNALVRVSMRIDEEIKKDFRVKDSVLRMEEEKNKKVEKIVADLKQEYEAKKLRSQGSPSRQLQVSQSEENLEDFQKWLRQQEVLGNGVKSKLEGHKSKLQMQLEVLNKMAKNDIRDNRSVQREFEASSISVDKLTKLFEFIGLKAGDVSVKEMDAVLKAQSRNSSQP